MALLFRDMLAWGFAELNKQGIFAAQNWSCCQTCGRHEIETIVKIPEDATYAFYHSQSEDGLREREEANKPSEINIYWNGDAKRICEILKSVGLGVEWEGPGRAIRLFEPPRSNMN